MLFSVNTSALSWYWCFITAQVDISHPGGSQHCTTVFLHCCLTVNQWIRYVVSGKLLNCTLEWNPIFKMFVFSCKIQPDRNSVHVSRHMNIYLQAKKKKKNSTTACMSQWVFYKGMWTVHKLYIFLSIFHFISEELMDEESMWWRRWKHTLSQSVLYTAAEGYGPLARCLVHVMPIKFSG